MNTSPQNSFAGWLAILTFACIIYGCSASSDDQASGRNQHGSPTAGPVSATPPKGPNLSALASSKAQDLLRAGDGDGALRVLEALERDQARTGGTHYRDHKLWAMCYDAKGDNTRALASYLDYLLPPRHSRGSDDGQLAVFVADLALKHGSKAQITDAVQFASDNLDPIDQPYYSSTQEFIDNFGTTQSEKLASLYVRAVVNVKPLYPEDSASNRQQLMNRAFELDPTGWNVLVWGMMFFEAPINGAQDEDRSIECFNKLLKKTSNNPGLRTRVFELAGRLGRGPKWRKLQQALIDEGHLPKRITNQPLVVPATPEQHRRIGEETRALGHSAQ